MSRLPIGSLKDSWTLNTSAAKENEKTYHLFFVCSLITFVLLYGLVIQSHRFEVRGDVEYRSLSNENVLTSLPDFSAIRDVSERKEAFFRYLRPLIEIANQDIVRERKRLILIAQSFSTQNRLSEKDEKFIQSLMTKYQVKPHHELDQILLKLDLKVNVIPASLALAQAANESAWGRSRFALEGNNLFGQWCFKQGCGIIPQSRPKGKRYEVARFSDPLKSIKSYMKNLNSFHVYSDFRQKRYEIESNEMEVTGYELANTLINYSTRKEAYIKELKALIVQNHLDG